MAQRPKVFLISPVQRVTPEENARIGAYVAELEASGKEVHWPIRDTKQEDPTGGFTVCSDNFQAMAAAHEIHIWYAESSGGSKFDMGIVFAFAMMDMRQRIVIANDGEIPVTEGKCFIKVMRHLIALQV